MPRPSLSAQWQAIQTSLTDDEVAECEEHALEGASDVDDFFAAAIARAEEYLLIPADERGS